MPGDHAFTKNRFATLLTRPHVAILAGFSLSFCAWLLPAISFAGKGFVAEPSTTMEVVRTVIAYLTLAGFSAAGFYAARPIGRRFCSVSSGNPIDLREKRVWTLWILLAAVGVMSALMKVVAALGIGGCIQAVTTFNANSFKSAIYTDYSIGLLTLRYVAILAAAIAIFRYLAFKEISLRSIASVGLLLVVALISSRLSIVWAVVIGVTTYLLAPGEIEKRKITFGETIAWGTIVVVVIGALTISRTYGFYQSHGANSVHAAVGSEFQRYLAAPFQGSMEAVNNPQPTSRLNEQAGIDGSLTTNSALLEFTALFGTWNIIALGMVLMTSGFACGLLLRFHSTHLIAAFGVLQCCHLEIWRLVMFQRGITLTMLAVTLIVSVLVAVVQLPSLRLPTVRVRLR